MSGRDISDILERILARKVEEVAERRATRSLGVLEAAASPPPRPFVGAMQATMQRGRAAIIAEIKRASPSKGVLREAFHPADIAVSYQCGGATCLSVLTDKDFFQGTEDHLRAARAACRLPVLRKDFIVDPYQVFEARAMGADAVLLIVAALDESALRALTALAVKLGMAVLIEVHDGAQLEIALSLDASLIGINNRDLRTFETRLETTFDLVRAVPDDRIVVTESGIHTHDDVKAMRDQGVNAFLVGESLMRADDPGERLAALFG